MKTLLLLLFCLSACAPRTVTIAVPQGGTPEQQAAQTINSAISVLKDLGGSPNDVRIVFQRPEQAAQRAQNRGF